MSTTEKCNCHQSLKLIEMNKKLLDALKRLTNAVMADYKILPEASIKFLYQTNQTAIEKAITTIKQAEVLNETN